MRSLRVLFTVISLSVLVAFVSGSAFADQDLKVKVSPGMSSDYSSDITLDALKSGKMDYTVSGMGKTYKVKLTEQQVKDVLGGTTVMVDSMTDGASGVRVSLTVEGEAESSGW